MIRFGVMSLVLGLTGDYVFLQFIDTIKFGIFSTILFQIYCYLPIYFLTCFLKTQIIYMSNDVTQLIYAVSFFIISLFFEVSVSCSIL